MIHYRRRSLRYRRLLVSAVALMLAGLAMLTPAGAAQPKVLVGFGDSYSSGVGNTDTGACGRSPIAYPTLATAWLEIEGKNFACSGAVISSLDEPFGGQSAQLDYLKATQSEAGVDYVALTIGGNDIGALQGAVGLLSGSSLPEFEDKVESAIPGLTGAYESVRDTAPNADVYVLGYPNIFPTSNDTLEACFGRSFAGLIDLSNGVTAVNTLNDGLATAVQATGDPRVHFVPVETFGGHDFCSEEPWAYGLKGRGSLHPNAEGHDEMARLLANAILETPSAPPAQLQDLTTTSTSTPSTSTAAPTTSTSTSTAVLRTVITSAPTSTTAKPAPTTTAPRPAPTTTAPRAPRTTTTTAPLIVNVTTSTAPVEVLDQAVTAPQLAYTGSSITGHLALGFLLSGIGLSLLWLRLQQRDRVARMVIPVRNR